MTTDNPYRALPSVDRLLADERLRPLAAGQRPVVTEIVRQALETARVAVAEGRPPPSEDQLVESVLGLAEALFRPSLRPVINATGVIIHTNLGRAPLSEDAIAAMAAISRGYSNLEFDLEAGERGSRFVHLEGVLSQLTGAERAQAFVREQAVDGGEGAEGVVGGHRPAILTPAPAGRVTSARPGGAVRPSISSQRRG